MAKETYVRGQLYQVNPANLHPDPEQPRKYIDPVALSEMTESVRQYNIIQPVLFRRDEAGLPVIVAGEIRCTAALAAGLTTVPAIFIDGENYQEISLIENVMRSNLTAIEEAEAFDRLMISHAYQQDDLARIFCKAKSTISETLSLTKLPETVRNECRMDPTVPKHLLIEIARKKQERSMITAFEKYKIQVNSKKNPRTGGKVAPVQSAMNAVEATGRRVGSFKGKIAEQTLEDLDRFIAALECHKQTIDDVLLEAKEQAGNMRAQAEADAAKAAEAEATATVAVKKTTKKKIA